MAGELLPGQLSEGLDTPAVGRYAIGYVELTGGQAADTDTVVIDGRTYEFDFAPVSITGDVGVDISGSGSSNDDVVAMETDITADAGATSVVDMGGNVAAIVANDPSTPGNVSLAVTGANPVRSAATLVGGEAKDLIPLERVRYVLTAADVTTLGAGSPQGDIPIGCIDLGIATANLGLYSLTIQTATGQFKTPATVRIRFITVSGTKSLIVLGDAAVTLAATDIIRMLISAQ